MQHKFNGETIENYLDEKLNWNSAIIPESGEMLDSLGYKWWKKQVIDMDNVKVEAIDLLHFVISETMQLFYDIPSTKNKFLEKTIDELAYAFEDDIEYFNNFNNKTLIDLVEQFVLSDKGERRFLLLKVIFNRLEMSNEDIYIAYIVKNCLNKFRQDNGYKDGTYIKMWNGVEDNVIAYTIAKEWGADEELFHHLSLDLDSYYKENVLK